LTVRSVEPAKENLVRLALAAVLGDRDTGTTASASLAVR
jgi:hypothetical protein